MSTKTETAHDGEFVVSEANGYLSRDQVTVHVAAGEKWSPGLILMITANKYVARTDASTVAKGILFNECDNSASLAAVDFQATVINADAEVLGPSCDANGGTEATVLSELLALGIKVRGDLANVAT